MKTPLITLAVIGLIAITGGTHVAASPQEKNGPADKGKAVASLKGGAPAPPLKVTRWLQGTELKAFEPGKVYVVEFWATWCGPCIAFMPHLAELQTRYRDQGVTIIGYSAADPNNSEEKVAAFIKQHGAQLKYSFAYGDDRTTYDAWMTAAGREGIPCSFVVDKTGRIAYIGHPMMLDLVLPKVVAGTASARAVSDEIDRVLAEYGDVSQSAARDPKAGLQALKRFEAKYPRLTDFLPSMRVKLSYLPKYGNPGEAKTYAEALVASASKRGDRLTLTLVSAILRLGDGKESKELLAVAVKAAEAIVRLDDIPDARALLALAEAYFAVGDRARAGDYARKAFDAAASEPAPMQRSIEKRARELVDATPKSDDMTFKVDSNLRAAVAKVDITPPSGTPIAGHVRKYDGVRGTLHAVVLLLDDGRTKAAIVTTDLIETGSGVTEAFRAAVAEATGTRESHIMVAAAHNHSGPGWRANPEWNRKVIKDVTAAVTAAAKDMRPVSVGYGEDRIDFNINRRKLIEGKSVLRLNADGPCDKRVKVLRFDDGRSLDPLAVLMHCVCHPCVHTWGDKFSPPYANGYPKASADFPGEARAFVEKVYNGRTKALFLQGCAGDIRPNLPGFPYRCGDEADIRWIGRNLGCAVVRAADRTAVREAMAKRPTAYPIRCANKVVELPAVTNGKTIRCELQAMKVGPFLFLTLPGEPFVEYGFRLEKAIADRAVPIVVGYANGSIGYICTAQAHKEGGYEPNNSQSGPGAEAILIAELLQLADRVVGDVFESFAPPRVPGRKDKK